MNKVICGFDYFSTDLSELVDSYQTTALVSKSLRSNKQLRYVIYGWNLTYLSSWAPLVYAICNRLIISCKGGSTITVVPGVIDNKSRGQLVLYWIIVEFKFIASTRRNDFGNAAARSWFLEVRLIIILRSLTCVPHTEAIRDICVSGGKGRQTDTVTWHSRLLWLICSYLVLCLAKLSNNQLIFLKVSTLQII